MRNKKDRCRVGNKDVGKSEPKMIREKEHETEMSAQETKEDRKMRKEIKNKNKRKGKNVRKESGMRVK